MWDAVFTAWKMSKHEVISGPYFPLFGLNIGKYGQEITSYLDTSHSDSLTHFWPVSSFYAPPPPKKKKAPER